MALAAVELHQDAPPIDFIVDEAQQVERLYQPIQLLQRASQLGREVLGLQGPDQARGLHRAKFERAGQAQQVVPVLDDELHVDALGSQFVQGQVGFAVQAPEPSAADVG